MSEPSEHDIADVLSSCLRTIKEQEACMSELRDSFAYFSGSLVTMITLVACLGLGTLTYWILNHE